MAPDSTLSGSYIWNEHLQRYAIMFQAAPWLETTFSYADFRTPRSNSLDRQFDIKLKLWDEGLYIPQVAIGLQDFLGTGLFSGEYIVASKQLGPLDLSFGVGWGVLGSRGSISNPLRVASERFDRREVRGGEDQGGSVNFGQFFKGEDIGFFGGVSYQTPIKGLQLIAEFDSDDNSEVVGRGDNPYNFGLVYNPTPGLQITASYLGFEDLNLQATFSSPVGEEVLEVPAGDPPPLFHVREERSDTDGGADRLHAPVQPPLFTPIPTSDAAFGEILRDELDREGIDLISVQAGSTAVRVKVENKQYRSEAKAVGRTARILSRYAPAEIETFLIVVEERSLETGEFKLSRTLLENSAREIGYSLAPPSLGFAYIVPGSEPVDGPVQKLDSYPKFDWYVGPSVNYSLFDPTEPFRFEIEALATGRVDLAPGLSLTAAVGRGLIGNVDDDDRLGSDSKLPRVRTDIDRYDTETDIGLYKLHGTYLFNAAPNVYGKISAGLLERMYAGAGGEMLYRPAYSRFAFGAEAYYVKQRDFDTLLSFRDYQTLTGHASVYYDTPYANWNVALHAGRYLARDWGGTLELSRRFPNGWEIGAYATFTDVPFSTFGEGSFDKGITLNIPFDWALKRDTQEVGNINLRPIQRDGGQRLDLDSRLFGLTQGGSRGEVEPQWNTFAH